MWAQSHSRLDSRAFHKRINPRCRNPKCRIPEERYWRRRACVCGVYESKTFNSPSREVVGFRTHHFNVLQRETCSRHGIGIRVDVRHVAPILCFVSGNAGRSVGIAEDESKHVGAIDHSFEVIDLRFVRWIPRAVEASVVLLHSWGLGGWPNVREMIQIHCRPESDEKQNGSGVCVRHGSCGVIQGIMEGICLQEVYLDRQH